MHLPEIEPAEPASRRARRSSSRWVVFVVCLGALLAIVPLWGPLTLAAWVAIIAYPLHNRLTRKLGGRRRAAAAMTVSLVLLALVPAVALTMSLVSGALDMGRQLMSSPDGAAALRTLVSSSGSDAEKPAHLLRALNVQSLIGMAQRYGASAWHALSLLAGAATKGVVGVLVFLLGVHEFLVNGAPLYGWLVEHAPIPRAHTHRLANAFSETGRGLFVGTGLTALLQGAVATIGYVALGIGQAFVLGAVTVVAGLIPSGGTTLVWGPVTAALVVGGRPIAALVMLGIGIFISTADNLVRPILSRYGKLRMPTYLLLVSALGGIAMFGAGGIVLGPLLVRLAMEGLEILREQPTEPARLD